MTEPVSEVEVRRDGGVLQLRIDREDKRNALSAEVMRIMLDAVRGVANDESARVVVVSSAGGRIFCAGADLAVMAADSTGLEQHEGRGLLAKLVIAMRECPVPVVAKVQGLCLAGGVGLVAGCDVVLARQSADFGLPEIDRGLWPFMVSALLARHVSPKHAMDRMLTGERFDARTAYEIGLVSRVFADATFEADVEAYVAKLAASPPAAVRLGKAAWVAATETTSLPIALEAMQAQLSLVTTTTDAAEGIAAFFDKRPPRWTGR
ncbi:MAG TPA: enoyl-CoA hydratase-related protein [Mycobacteriales bacterium]|jgi:enoyl-CoA hydratase/carnithine racemase|nr:enoyl-CoA hydratase-related protein [Mycobacteriales bacterium]